MIWAKKFKKIRIKYREPGDKKVYTYSALEPSREIAVQKLLQLKPGIIIISEV